MASGMVADQFAAASHGSRRATGREWSMIASSAGDTVRPGRRVNVPNSARATVANKLSKLDQATMIPFG